MKSLLGLFVPQSRSSLVRRLLTFPLPLRRRIMARIPMGVPRTRLRVIRTQPFKRIAAHPLLLRKQVLGKRVKPQLSVKLETESDPLSLLVTNGRCRLYGRVTRLAKSGIATARSKWEAGVRQIIGGGELQTWRADNNKYRGGGNLHDAILLLADADDTSDFVPLDSLLSVDDARAILCLPSGLSVPDGPECCIMKHYNDEATGGPLLRSAGIKGKYGLKNLIEEFTWCVYNEVAEGELSIEQLPGMTARVGYRSKLMSSDKAFAKMKSNKPLGRTVMMMDATEQAFASPLFNVISDIISKLHTESRAGWRNYLVRASENWIDFWNEIKGMGTIVELDWKKFDRERPSADILFFIDVIVSCFTPRSEREARLLSAYKRMMVICLVERVLILDNGALITVDGMVPSGSLWTGVCDTALNILYITAALRSLGFADSEFSPKCAGDDNLTLFQARHSKHKVSELRLRLNEWFRAGIEPEDFIVHFPPYCVFTEQACFPPGTDLALGTSNMMDKAKWVRFNGPCPINEPEGRSHRWRYNFNGKPKFLANYFLPDGRPIRPAKDNLEKLLWPEGIHKTLEQYEAAVISMVVDNPFNDHNVNHLMHRYVIIQQIKELSFDMEPDLVMQLAAIRGEGEEPVPYPMIGFYRRQTGRVILEEVPELKHYIKNFQKFVSKVSTLYMRRSEGGMDAWRFMDIVRGQHSIGAGQFGNDILQWCKFLNENKLTKSLRAARRFRVAEKNPTAEGDVLDKARDVFQATLSFCKGASNVTAFSYAIFVSQRMRDHINKGS